MMPLKMSRKMVKELLGYHAEIFSEQSKILIDLLLPFATKIKADAFIENKKWVVIIKVNVGDSIHIFNSKLY